MEKKMVYNLANSITMSKVKAIEYEVPEINEIEINMSQLKRNFNIIKSFLKAETKFMAVLKGDACGNGMIPVAEELVKLGCDAFGVVRLVEAFTLREVGVNIPILLLSPIIPLQASWIVKYDITPMVDSYEIAQILNEYAFEYNKILNIHVKVNTGLNRYGVSSEKAVTFIRDIKEKYSNLLVEGVYTHFQDPDYNENFTCKQIELLNKVITELERENLRPRLVHAASSTAIIKYPQSHYDMVRCGTLLYGIEHEQGQRDMPDGIKNLMTLKARIIEIKKIRKGEAGGYGSKFIAKKDSTIAIVGVGYGDGVSRGWKEVLISGKRVPVVNYFMDGLMIDISDLAEEVNLYDEAVIIGYQGEEEISWLEACKYLQCYVDEELESITERVPRKYIY